VQEVNRGTQIDLLTNEHETAFLYNSLAELNSLSYGIEFVRMPVCETSVHSSDVNR